ncbi:MAG: hypothetical protein ACK8QZ_01555, partial [Anaerolineales bacterium]
MSFESFRLHCKKVMTHLSHFTSMASAADRLSGLARLGCSLDGAAWCGYSAPVVIGDGVYISLLRAIDLAGNVSEPISLTFQVDGTPPRIELTDAWYIWESGEVKVRDGQSGLAGVEIEIRDRQGRWPKVMRSYETTGDSFTTAITWDRRFADGTLAPIGEYEVVVEAFDRAGNSSRATARIVIPAPNVTPTSLPTATAQPTLTPTAPPIATLAGGFSLPAQPRPSPTPPSGKWSTLSFSSASPPATQVSATGNGVLWGGAALAAIATATAAAIAARRR